jgi:hypothetical protein
MPNRARVDWIAGGLTLGTMTQTPLGGATSITAHDTAGHTWRIALEHPRALAVWLRGPQETGEPWEHDPRTCIACDNHKPFTVPLPPNDA